MSGKKNRNRIEARREGDIGSLIANTDLAKNLLVETSIFRFRYNNQFYLGDL